MKPGRRPRRNALAGEGPIVNRARTALKHTAAQFGEVTAADQTTVTVRTTDGIALTLSYDPGNYIFSRVYNLRIVATLPQDTRVPSGIELSFREKGAVQYVQQKVGQSTRPAPGPRLQAVNRRLGEQLRSIDLIASTVDGRTLSIVPMGGSFVWVLIPPVFKATAFPAGEVERILGLIRSFRSPRIAEAAVAA